MCGICGVLGEGDKKTLKRMMDAISHRGPDSSGIYIDKNIFLGHRRLSIIDLKTGNQPMHNEDETVWLIFNGEIYNYIELRKKLEKQGHRFQTKSDSETIIHLYEEYGNSFVKKLRGMFAFALIDKKRKKLLLVRDRVGIKPLYYTWQNNNLVFASEIKSIFQYPGIEAEIRKASMNEFLMFGYVSGHNTLFRGIKKLPQGSILVLENGRKTIKRYWELGSEIIKERESYFIENLKKKLRESIKLHMISDVPVGLLLSGGIDSSYILSIMKGFTDKPVKTFSVGFDVKGYDELEYARFVSDYFETDHNEIIIGPEHDILPKIAWHIEEPPTDPALLPVYKVSELVRKKRIKVVLTGDGADEQFAGYNIHKIMYANRLYYKYTPGFAAKILKMLPAKFRTIRGIRFATLSKDPLKTFYNYMNNFNEREKDRLYNANTKAFNIPEINRILTNLNETNIASKLMKLDFERLLPNYFLMKTDKMTMACSIEARVPYLDHVLAEFNAKIPGRLQLKNFKEKYVLKKAAGSMLPKKIITRPKHGFDVPIKEWFEKGMIDIAEGLLTETETKKLGMFNQKYIEKLLKLENMKKTRQLWNLMMFQIWHKSFIELGCKRKPYKLNELM